MKLTILLLSLIFAFPGLKAPSDKTVYLVRHGETCTEQGSNPHLSVSGTERANELARVLMEVELESIYSTPFNRTIETASPVAESQGVDVSQVSVGSGFLAALAEKIKTSTDRVVLVSGHSNTTPALVNLLIGTEFKDLNELDFDRLYVVTLHEDGSGSVSVLRYGAVSGKPQSC